ncbi:hypothetical protein JMJ35_003202 [Cladonia borealis]|uniref:Uncharacterized protein n=1 Tax=Cladonia borealis TaxID=184061 RepID=A0AA39R4D4_9LECA|nr:hypothetical protein JMJ35_003202 [Cladonia borealis]
MPPLLTSSADLIRHPLALRSLLPSLHELAPRSLPIHLPFLPTRTVPPINAEPLSLASLFRRQVVTVTATAPPPAQTTNPLIPTTYSGLNAGPTPGTVVGIVFGSVAGFLLLLWLIYTCFGLNNNGVVQSSVVDERRETEVVETRRSRRTSTRRSSPHRPPPPESSQSASEIIEVESRRDRTPPRRESRRETVIIEETRRRPAEEDIVEVIEEHSPVRRESTKRERRVSSGYRNVDPEAFAGGDRPQRKVRR